MKKITWVLFYLVFFLQISFAQDVIVTSQAKRIEAIVTEVSPTEIKYKKFSNPNGPIFILYVSNISAIIYQNGEVQMFNENKGGTQNVASSITKKPTTSEKVVPSNVPSSKGSQTTTTNVVDSSNKKITTPKDNFAIKESENALGKIYRDDGEYTFQGRYISKKEYGLILQNNCPIAYAEYRRSQKLTNASWILVGVGGGLVLGGLSVMGTSPEASLALCAVAIVPLVVAIPLVTSASKKDRNSIDLYNQHCSSKVALNFNINTNGVGLALNF